VFGLLCRLFGHRYQTVFDTGSWSYRECSRCHERAIRPSRGEPRPFAHEPDAAWLSGADLPASPMNPEDRGHAAD
jgi:hypothetical protein